MEQQTKQAEKVKIVLVLGTNRKARKSELVAKWALHHIEKNSEIEIQFFDAKDFKIPSDDYGTEASAAFPEWKNAVIAADALILVTPEYNHGYPGILKSIMDLLLKEYIHKCVGFISVSSESVGGARVIEALVPIVRELGLVSIFNDVSFSKVESLFNEIGELIDPAPFEKQFKAFIEELLWMARSLRWGRTNLASKHHSSKQIHKVG